MLDLASHPITKRWQPMHPERLQLYSLPTPNGLKVSMALEELALAYEAHKVSFSTDDQFTPEFLALNPNNKIPAIIDPEGPGGRPIGIWESGAILVYLAEKVGRLLPSEPHARYETLQWLMFQMGGVGPMFGQFGHFYKFAADKVENNPYPTERYANETRRLLGVLDARLDGREWIMDGEFTIADLAIGPWVRGLSTAYEAEDHLKLGEFPNVGAWLERFMARDGVKRGLGVPD